MTATQIIGLSLGEPSAPGTGSVKEVVKLRRFGCRWMRKSAGRGASLSKSSRLNRSSRSSLPHGAQAVHPIPRRAVSGHGSWGSPGGHLQRRPGSPSFPKHPWGNLRQDRLASACFLRLIAQGLGRLGWTELDRVNRPKGDPAKLELAHQLRARTTLSVAWVAQHLSLGSRAHLAWLLKTTTPASPRSPHSRLRHCLRCDNLLN